MFEFWNTSGKANVITDFHHGEDLIAVKERGTSFAGLTITADGDHTLVMGKGFAVKLLNVDSDIITADDFIF